MTRAAQSTHPVDPSDPQTILLLGNYRPALTVARQLAAAGHTIWVSQDQEAGAASRSRAVAGVWPTPDNTDPTVLYSALADFLAQRPDITVVFPLMESYVRAFSDHAHRLPQDRLYVMPNADAVATCLDKARLLTVVDDAGLACARHIPVRDHAGLIAAAQTVDFPLVVKPADSTIWLGTRKALILHNRAALDAAMPDWPTEHAELIVQSYVDGPRVNLYFAADRGRAVRYLAVEIGQTDIADGTGLATDGTSIALDPALRAMGDAMIDRLQYHGVGCLQAMRDRVSGAYSFLELNPRIGGNHAITAHAGLGLEDLALRLAADQPVDRDLHVGPAGLTYVWTTGALRGLGIAMRNGELSVLSGALKATGAVLKGLMTRCHVTFTLADPRPTLTLLGRLLRR